MGNVIAILFERLLPEALEPLLQEAIGETVQRAGDDGLHRIIASGGFSGPQTADLLAFARSQKLTGALLLVEHDVQRVLYFSEGSVAAAQSDVYFERLGRVLMRDGVLDREDGLELAEYEESHGTAAVVARLPEEAARWGLEMRAWDVASALYFTRNAHFLIVEGPLLLEGVPLFAISSVQLAMEGMRSYDEWRNGPGEGLPPAGDDRPASAPADVATVASNGAPARQGRPASVKPLPDGAGSAT